MRNMTKHPDGSRTIVLHLKPEEQDQLKQLALSMGMNDFDAIKYAVRLVSWWSKGKIEPESERNAVPDPNHTEAGL